MENSSNKRIAKNTLFLYIRMLLVMGVGLFSSRIILQALGTEDYGLYNVVGSIVVMFSIINGTLSSGTSRFLTFELGKGDFIKLKKTFNSALVMHIAVACIVLLISETVGLWFLNNKMTIPADKMYAANWLYQFSILTCLLSLTQVPYNALIIAHEKMNVYAWVGIIEVLYKLLIIYIIYYSQSTNKLILYGFLILLWNAGVQVFYRLYCRKKYAESALSFVKDKCIYENLLSFSLWDIIGAFCVQGNAQGINILTNMFFGVAVNAARGIAFQVENALTLFSANFMVAVKPQIVKLYADNKIDKMLKLVIESSKASFYLLFLVSLPVFLETEYILSLWLVEVPAYTVIFVKCIIAVRLFRAFNTPIVQAVHATGKIKWMNMVSGGASIALQIPLTYLLYKIGFEPQYTFLVLAIAYLICNYLELYSLKREVVFSIFYFTKKVYIKGIIITFVASVIPYMITQSMTPSFGRLIATVAVSIVSAVICIFYFGITKEYRNLSLTFIKKKIRYAK